MSGKYALIIGNTEYTDQGLAQLTAPSKDAEDFARVLKDQGICAFDAVKVLLNQLSSSVIEAIDEFFDQKKPDDLLVLFFSGHGVRDEFGSLYLAVRNTIRSRLRSTAIKSDYIREVMDQSRSRRQVLILDCCNSGAFAQGTKAEVGGVMGMASAFQGYGRYVLTASDATQFAWEGNKVIGETENSLFTHFLVKGLEGNADSDGDGKITVDELYDYAFEQIVRLTPKQKPNKSATRQEGEIILRQITRIEDIKPISLPGELMEATQDLRTFVREGAVQQLEKLLKGKNLGLARSAREALERMEKEDDSRRVSQAATQALETIRQMEQKAEKERRARQEAERLTKLKAEDERLATEKAAERLLAEKRAQEQRTAEEKGLAEATAAANRKAKEEADRLFTEEEAERLATVKAEEAPLASERDEAEPQVTEEVGQLVPSKARLEAEPMSMQETGSMFAEQRVKKESIVEDKIETGNSTEETHREVQKPFYETRELSRTQFQDKTGEKTFPWTTSMPFYKVWISAIARPTIKNYDEISRSAHLSTVFLWIFTSIAILVLAESIMFAIIGFRFYSILGDFAPSISSTATNEIPRISEIVITGLVYSTVLYILLFFVGFFFDATSIYLVAKLLNGKGSFAQTVYSLTTFGIPIILFIITLNIFTFTLFGANYLQGVASILEPVDPIGPTDNDIWLSIFLVGIVGFMEMQPSASIPLRIGIIVGVCGLLYMLYLRSIVFQAVHHISRAKAIIASLVIFILPLMCFFVLFFFYLLQSS